VWFLWIKWIWFDVWEFIQQERQKNWNYKSLEDLLKRCDTIINKKSLEWLIKSWALDKFYDRNTLINNIQLLLERSKSSQNMNMWLFGLDENTQKISFNKRYETSFEDKLMMEQDVFKCFVSWHLLDWLYPYIKKSSFLSRLNIEKNIWPYKITWYISNIQRAKKKWYFIEIEDISSKREFFFKDILDFKKFDLVIISWFKQEWRYPKISKLIKTNRETLIRNAWSSYDEDMTVTKAKGMRLWELKLELLLDNEINKESDNIWLELSDEDINNIEIDKIEKIEFDIPNKIWDIEIMKTILIQHPGNINIKIWNMDKKVSQEWLDKIRSLL
jgi:DNA polymerase III alpha subunit